MWNFLTRAFSGGQCRGKHPVQSDSLVYAVGDVHGRVDLLEPLVEKILNDVLQTQDAGAPPPEVVFIGDVIDRGPDSAAVLEMLTAIETWPEIKPVFLSGNHEEMLLGFLEDPAANKRWLRYGGYETLLSYQLDLKGDLFDDDNVQQVAVELANVMGAHVDLLKRFVRYHRNGNMYFVHAGADPTQPVESQSSQTLVWGEKLDETKPRRDGMWIVHGHTVVEKPVVRGGRISIDTGAYLSGALTALRVEADKISFLRETGGAEHDTVGDPDWANS